MSTSKEYMDFLLDQLSDLEEIEYRPMMGEYIIYYRRKVAAYICNDRMLVRPLDSAKALMPNAPFDSKYEGAKKNMLLVEDVDNKELLTTLFQAMYEQLPEPKPKKPKKKSS